MKDRGKHEHWLGNLLQDLMPCTEYKWNINFVGESWNVLGCSWRQFEMMNEFSIFHFHSVNGKFPFDNFNSYSLFTLILKFSNSPYISSHFYRLWDLVRSYHHLRRVEKSSTSSSICMRCVQIVSTTLKYSDFPHFHRDKSSLVKRKIYINFLDQSPPEKCKTFWLNEDKD